MNPAESRISSELKSQLNDFFELANDDNLQNKDEILSKKSKELLEKLELTKSSIVSIAEREFLDLLISKITVASQSLKWEEIPPPETLTLAYEHLAQVTAALQTVLANFFPDIMEVMKELIAINGKQQLQKMREALFNFTNQVLAAEAQFRATEKANAAQKSADYVQAGMQLGGSLMTIGSASTGVIKSVPLLKDSKKYLKEAKQLHELNSTLDIDIKNTQHSQTLLQGKKAADTTGKYTQHHAISESNLNRSALIQNQAKDSLKRLGEINQIKLSKLQTRASQLSSQTQLINAFSGMFNSAGTFGSTFLKGDSSRESLDSQKAEFVKNMSQNFYQDAMERNRSLKEAIEATLQAARTIMQALDSAIAKSV